MDNRLIFLYHLNTLYDAVTQKDRQSGLMVEPVQALRVHAALRHDAAREREHLIGRDGVERGR